MTTKKKTVKSPSVSTEKTGRSSKSLEYDSAYEQFDLDHDGIVSDEEIQHSEKLVQLDKLQTQKRMSWLALISMIVLTVVLLSPAISEKRLTLLDELISMYYIAMAGVVCGYFGVSAWMSKK